MRSKGYCSWVVCLTYCLSVCPSVSQHLMTENAVTQTAGKKFCGDFYDHRRDAALPRPFFATWKNAHAHATPSCGRGPARLSEIAGSQKHMRTAHVHKRHTAGGTIKMPQPYSVDLRWRIVWVTQIQHTPVAEVS